MHQHTDNHYGFILLKIGIGDTEIPHETESDVYLLVGCHGSVGVLVCGIATQGFVVIPSAGLLAEAAGLSIRVDSSKPFVALARIQLLEKWAAHVYSNRYNINMLNFTNQPFKNLY